MLEFVTLYFILQKHPCTSRHSRYIACRKCVQSSMPEDNTPNLQMSFRERVLCDVNQFKCPKAPCNVHSCRYTATRNIWSIKEESQIPVLLEQPTTKVDCQSQQSACALSSENFTTISKGPQCNQAAKNDPLRNFHGWQKAQRCLRTPGVLGEAVTTSQVPPRQTCMLVILCSYLAKATWPCNTAILHSSFSRRGPELCLPQAVQCRAV